MQLRAATLCIHSVVVAERFRRDKIGSRMLKEYLEHVSANLPEVELVLLICKAYLKSFYASCGTCFPNLSQAHHHRPPLLISPV